MKDYYTPLIKTNSFEWVSWPANSVVQWFLMESENHQNIAFVLIAGKK